MQYISEFIQQNNLRLENQISESRKFNQNFQISKTFQKQILVSIKKFEDMISVYRLQQNFSGNKIFSQFLINLEKKMIFVSKIFENYEFEILYSNFFEKEKEKEIENSAILTRFVLHALADFVKNGISTGSFFFKIFSSPSLTRLIF